MDDYDLRRRHPRAHRRPVGSHRARRLGGFFGVAALPLSWVTWAVLSWSVDFTPISASLVPRLLGGAVMLLVGCVVLSFVVAPVFVLTPNAISYEGLSSSRSSSSPASCSRRWIPRPGSHW